MKEKFTPGPWRAELPEAGFRFAKTGDWLVTSSDGLIVAMAIHDKPPEAEPNAHLIAAAPDLHKALDAAKNALRSYQYGNASPELAEAIADMADKALAKAEGRS